MYGGKGSGGTLCTISVCALCEATTQTRFKMYRPPKLLKECFEDLQISPGCKPKQVGIVHGI